MRNSKHTLVLFLVHLKGEQIAFKDWRHFFMTTLQKVKQPKIKKWKISLNFHFQIISMSFYIFIFTLSNVKMLRTVISTKHFQYLKIIFPFSHFIPKEYWSVGFCLSLLSRLPMNQTVENQTSLEDFEEFDLRDAINVAVYGFMSVGKLDNEQQ